MTKENKLEEINNALPQTQCGLCGYGACKPYAKAILEDHAPLNLCPPGGLKTLEALGALTQTDVSPWKEEMQAKAKLHAYAHIDEDVCIGCTKCISACPVDAILGSAKAMHTVLVDECTGCELCIAPCPVDCITMLPHPNVAKNIHDHAPLAKKRFDFRNKRLNLQTDHKPQQKFNENKLEYIKQAAQRARQKRQTNVSN